MQSLFFSDSGVLLRAAPPPNLPSDNFFPSFLRMTSFLPSNVVYPSLNVNYPALHVVSPSLNIIHPSFGTTFFPSHCPSSFQPTPIDTRPRTPRGSKFDDETMCKKITHTKCTGKKSAGKNKNNVDLMPKEKSIDKSQVVPLFEFFNARLCPHVPEEVKFEDTFAHEFGIWGIIYKGVSFSLNLMFHVFGSQKSM
uniref:Uncharacterized protein n=1 Tax=Cacopsylla melanoneura TaxID=428564 RepID=A0A8D8RH40_9HEMI